MASDNDTTDGRHLGSIKAAFAKALNLSPDVIERAEAGDQDAMKALYAALGDTEDVQPRVRDEFWSPEMQSEADAAINAARAIMPPFKVGEGSRKESHD
jgi:hypothetical protein